MYDSIFDNDPTELESKDILIIFDTSWVSHAAAAAKAFNWMQYEGKPTGHIYGSLSKILAAFALHGNKDINTTGLVFVFDNYPTEAHKIYPGYKANRSKTFNPVFDVKTMLHQFCCFFAHAPDTEADHVIGSIVQTYYQTHKIYVVSADKDLWQILDLGATFIPNNKSAITQADVAQKFELTNPKNIALYKAIFGDPSDNIPKLPGSGKLDHKIICKCIEQLPSSTPHEFYAHIKTRPDGMSERVHSDLLNGREWVEKIYQLTKLQTTIPYTLTSNIVQQPTELLEFLHGVGIHKFDTAILDLFYTHV